MKSQQKVQNVKSDLNKFFYFSSFLLIAVFLLLIYLTYKVHFIDKIIDQKIKESSRKINKTVKSIDKKFSTLEIKIDAIANRVKGAPSGGGEDAPIIAEVGLDDDPMIGNSNAPVIMVEFSEFQCPFCSRFNNVTFPLIKKDYINTGKVKYVVRDYPLPFHEQAQKAGEAASCAREQNKYWEMREKLFNNQQALDVPSLKKYAGEIGLNQNSFDMCLDSGKYEKEVKKDLEEGSKYGVKGVPGFFIGKNKGGSKFTGKLISGAHPFEKFKELIEENLK